jgi:hypothetical protein
MSQRNRIKHCPKCATERSCFFAGDEDTAPDEDDESPELVRTLMTSRKYRCKKCGHIWIELK